MAETSISVSKDEFNCSVCLQLLKDPVTVPCGHSYCMGCISSYWNRGDHKGVYSCPQCRKTFTPKPVLNKNTILAEMVKKLETKDQAAVPAHCYAAPGDVEWDASTDKKKCKGIKSYLSCKNSNCLEQHDKFHSGIECPYCKLNETHRLYQERIQRRQKELQKLRAVVECHKQSAQTAVEDCEIIFTELISSIERSCSEVTQLIRDEENAAVSRAEEVVKRLEQEIDDLRRRDAELEQLSHTDDHIHFCQSLFVPPESSDIASITVNSLPSFDNARKCVFHLKEKLEHYCREELGTLSDRDVILNPEPKTREQFLQYAHQLTLDRNTLHKRLCLSEENRAITITGGIWQYNDHPDRFDSLFQVLSRERVCGRSYWEVKWSGDVGISVSYKGISRKGRGHESEFGRNDQSWSLCCSDSRCTFWHNNIETKLPLVSKSCRIGVYVDDTAGTLSFYSICDSNTVTLIHSIQTTFTQPLYSGFRLYLNCKVVLCDLTT